MKQGIILYVLDGRDALPEWPDERQQVRGIKGDCVCTAFSEDDVHHHWCSLVTRGMRRILCVLADYDPAAEAMLLRSVLRLCG